MLSNSDDSSRAKRTATLNDLRFNRQSSSNPSPSSAFSSPSSSILPTLPAQSRDASLSSRFFPATPTTTGTVLVPSSSPIDVSPERPSFQSSHQPWNADVATNSNPTRPNSWNYQQRLSTYDPLSMPSGFLSNGTGVQPSLHQGSVGEGHWEGPPRKRVNRGTSPTAFSVDSPGSPSVQRPGQRRRVPSDSVDEITSSEDSLPEIAPGSSRARIVRGRPIISVETQPSQADDLFSDQRFVRFKMTMPTERPDRVKAAWLASGQDVKKATELLADSKWDPNPPLPPLENGKVESIVEANKAQRLATREKGKQSMIYANRNVLGSKPSTIISTPASKTQSATDLTTASPTTPLIRPRKRNKKMVLDSEPESSDEEDEREHKRSRTEISDEMKALGFFNTKSPEALQELSGCSMEQAAAIVSLRPFQSMEDLNARLGQGRKKAGPAGISPRLFEDCVDIFRGYSQVDSILEDCEDIGRDLRTSIASWTSNTPKSLSDDAEEDGALSLRSISIMENKKSKSSLFNQPSLLSDTVQLKEYQLLGVNWLYLLYKKGLSCILADEMGLGKTIQVISFFAYLKEQGNKGPHLVVVPSSTLENWCREFARFAPSLSVQTYYAGKNDRVHLRQTLLETRRAKSLNNDGWDVLVTTYNLAQGDGDRKFFRRIEWDCCVFDEGHVLKNFQSQRYQALLKVESEWRLLLTGTPLQNNLQELVSLMNFILPNQFADALDDLRAIFKVKGDSKVSLLAQERVSRAKKMMTPFVLRRRKDQVLKDLPKKIERIEWCEITPQQKTIYRDALQRSHKVVADVDVNEETSSSKGKKSRGGKAKEKQYAENSSNVLMDLRKAALHPMLFRSLFGDDLLNSITRQLLKEPDFQRRGALFDIVKEDMTVMTDAELQHLCGTYKSTRKFQQSPDCFLNSGKVQALMKLLDCYQKEGRKVLIFSQFTQILDILEVILKQKDINYLVLKGSTPVDVRQSLVDEFTEDDSIPIFLLSTKAGGMGINLTAASVVIMFDQDFNPHNDRQAQDRAYRIGQKQDVDVVKLITRDTIEEDILRLGQMKLALDEAVAGEDEKGESAPEREMRVSLMNVLRQQFEKQVKDSGDVPVEPSS
ncbi:DNA-dependent ATPase fun30 [Stygiomarasmius scandens]|uniref:DNA-dependent ATPase fun30 n=1 Tax=Marasmiellus scandens TaxID=2682957 RepID=A0ABR1K5K5_9AGAR